MPFRLAQEGSVAPYRLRRAPFAGAAFGTPFVTVAFFAFFAFFAGKLAAPSKARAIQRRSCVGLPIMLSGSMTFLLRTRPSPMDARILRERGTEETRSAQ